LPSEIVTELAGGLAVTVERKALNKGGLGLASPVRFCVVHNPFSE
jgi:hypothetical protein